jgi:DNA-binding MurR/RpiR family transcriptional regulator
MQLKPRKEMILTISELKQKGFKTAAITNNWKYEYDTEGSNNNSSNNSSNSNTTNNSNNSNNNNNSTTGQLFFNKHHHKYDLFRRQGNYI